MRGREQIVGGSVLGAMLALNITWLLGFYSFLLGCCLFPITLADKAPSGERLCKVCKAPLGDEMVCADCGKDHSPPVPKAVDAPLTDWQEGWGAAKDTLKPSRTVMALAGILHKRALSEARGKPWKPGAAELRFSFIFKRRPYPQEMAAAVNMVKAAEKFGATA